jgi:hypothetical protein
MSASAVAAVVVGFAINLAIDGDTEEGIGKSREGCRQV